ncbi:Abi family protein [Holdemania massiliensis]|uniref:Abi family protein n=1 Tax=Holdemania massiliensis TaxID=1468449 RepID=A0A6N7SC76_9FIRM|nr:Abi family protein [Holdemania massiliensis]MSA73275.1 hypothetical protein [Holdemania massiliensis]MSA91487.1 hypothetical protein [Holdemania massiliensis]MSB80363.1 hypothetical protein [Holdemania massiliensis]MSC35303.1 hypothetical protein [Holdemania massiliensis]MSC41677.1 hypothetical protein [Holdemania massiliensis]
MVDKPFKTYPQLVEILINSHGLIVQDKQNAIELLKIIPYYDLVNGYKEHFMVNDQYVKGMTLEYILLYALFDKSFQNILFKYSVYIESRFKNSVAYAISNHFGVATNDYLDITKYTNSSNSNKRNKKIKLFNTLNDTWKGSNISQPTLHYVQTKDHVPPWILFRNISFSSIIDLFTFLPQNLKEEVASDMILINISSHSKVELMHIAITIVRIFRNIIAHNLKFITNTSNHYEIKSKAIRNHLLGTLLTQDDIANDRGKNDRFSMAISTVLLLGNEILLGQFAKDIKILQAQFASTEQELKVTNDYFKNIDIPFDIPERIAFYAQALNEKQI